VEFAYNSVDHGLEPEFHTAQRSAAVCTVGLHFSLRIPLRDCPGLRFFKSQGRRNRENSSLRRETRTEAILVEADLIDILPYGDYQRVTVRRSKKKLVKV
jgi:hypothetical protein